MSIFKRNKKKQPATAIDENKRQIAIMERINVINRLSESGLIYLDEKSHKVVISIVVADMFIRDNVKWTNFLTNLQAWFSYEASSRAWKKYFLDVEVKAVRAARKKFAMITPAQERTIRMEARSAVDMDAVPAPEVVPFDFVIASSLSGLEEPRLIVVGRFEDGRFEMVPYEEVNVDELK